MFWNCWYFSCREGQHFQTSWFFCFLFFVCFPFLCMCIPLFLSSNLLFFFFVYVFVFLLLLLYLLLFLFAFIIFIYSLPSFYFPGVLSNPFNQKNQAIKENIDVYPTKYWKENYNKYSDVMSSLDDNKRNVYWKALFCFEVYIGKEMIEFAFESVACRPAIMRNTSNKIVIVSLYQKCRAVEYFLVLLFFFWFHFLFFSFHWLYFFHFFFFSFHFFCYVFWTSTHIL